jgi:large subunit ribosomal protein L17
MNKATFGRTRDSRNLLLRNLAASVILYESVVTTDAKARTVQPLVDRFIAIAKAGVAGGPESRVNAYRQLKQSIADEKAIVKLLDELTVRFSDTNSGFTRRYSVAPRLGDGAPQTIIQLTKTALLEPKAKAEAAK